MAEFGRNGCPTSLRARLQGLGGQSLSGVQWNSRQQHGDGTAECSRNRSRAGALYSNPARALGRAKLRDPSSVQAHVWLKSNENKMSDGGRDRASIGVEVWKSSQS
jgi:hypothetical protein